MKHLLSTCLLLSAFYVSGQSYWEELTAPDGGAPEKVTQTNNGWVYAEFYDHAVFCSQDNGQHWQQIFWPSDDPDTGFAKITVGRAGTLFAERKLGGAFPSPPYHFDTYKSVDNGETWQMLYDSSTVHGIGETSDGVWFGIKDTLLYSMSSVLLIRSSNGGSAWQQVYFVFSSGFEQIEVDQYDYIWVSEAFSEVVYSTNGGDTWIERGTDDNSTVVITALNTMICLGSEQQLVRYPVSGGVQYLQIDSFPNQYSVLDLMRLPDNTLYAITPYYLHKSVDDGVTWERLMDNNGVWDFPITSPLQDGTLLVNRLGALARSSDEGVTWHFSGFNMHRGSLNNIVLRNEEEWLALTDWGLFYTENAGISWNLRKEPQEINNYYRGNYLAADSADLYLLMDRALFYSPDLGQTFENITPPDSISKLVKGVGVNPQTNSIFVSSGNGTSRSVDKGITWQTVKDSFIFRKLLPHPSGLLYAVLDSMYLHSSGIVITVPYLFKSIDDGQTWSKILEPPVRDFTVTPQGGVFALTTDWKIARSDDFGINWTLSSFTAEIINSNAGGQLFAIASDVLRMSADNGITWQILPQPPALADASGTAYTGWGIDAQNRLFLSAWEYGGTGSMGHLFRTANSTLSGAYLTGTVFKDADGDCSTNDPESPLHDWIVRADGSDTWYTNTDSAGHYAMFLDTGAYFLSVHPSIGLLWESCADSLPVQLPDLLDTTVQDVPVRAVADCPYMTVEVAAPWLERCFESEVYVQYCNLGTEPADSAWVDVTLDPYLVFTDTLSGYEALGNNTFRFHLGAVATGACGFFNFSVYVDCDSTALGQTLCVSAHVYPDSLCIAPPGWSGAQIQVTARCEQDTALRFDVKNMGAAPSQGLQYFVIEDDVVLMQGDEMYQPAETKTFIFPANGHFRRFESEQEPGHPFSKQIAAWAEGCGGFDAFGFPNWYVLNNGIPSQDIFCGEIVGAFDPNDKQGFPVGYGPERLVPPNTEIEYLVRFQNTGTAPAHHVIIRDTLSTFLDPGSVRMGAASHPFAWSLSGQGILTVTFADINLPDSNANEAASHGFASLKIAQTPDLPDGTEIRNAASIYFDYNSAVRTNETLHRIGRDFITVDVTESPDPSGFRVHVAPNPVTETAVLSFEGLDAGEHRFCITDVAGRTLRETTFSGNTLTLKREGLASGVYFFRVADRAGEKAGAGKLLLR